MMKRLLLCLALLLPLFGTAQINTFNILDKNTASIVGGTITGTTINNSTVGLTTPAASAFTTINGNVWTTGTGTLTLGAGKTFTANNTLTLAGTDSTTITFPTTSATIARTDAAQTFTGAQTYTGQSLQADGTAAAPSYSFSNHPSTGFREFSASIRPVSLGNDIAEYGFASGMAYIALPQTANLTWGVLGTSVGLSITRDADGILAQRNGTNAQTDRLYNTFTDVNNGEWLERAWSGNTVTIAPKANGTGTVRQQVYTSPQITGYLTSGPVTNTGATYTIIASDTYLIANASGTQTLTLGAATAGRVLKVLTIAAFTVVSASSNVIPVTGGAAGTAILAATAGKWAELVGNGTNWQIMSSN